ncbi:MAG: LysE family translocator [Candidatus Altiarchaeota archaeon]|nr:LysE family translocator [Candidatus Altiarchaeota archaeon]
MDFSILLLLGFVVGLSGAMIPGPLLVYTISKTLRSGPLTGFYVILGHALVESILIVLVYLGAVSFFTNPIFYKVMSLGGGVALVYFAYHLYASDVSLKNDPGIRDYGAFYGGVFFTAFNPGFPLWWATAGARLLLEGYSRMGYFGGFLVLSGHWIADLTYYVAVSYLVYRGRERMVTKYASASKFLLAFLMLLLGLYFINSGFMHF